MKKLEDEIKERAYQFNPQDLDLPEEFKIDPELYYDLFDMAANIQLKILNMLGHHVIRMLRRQAKARKPQS